MIPLFLVPFYPFYSVNWFLILLDIVDCNDKKMGAADKKNSDKTPPNLSWSDKTKTLNTKCIVVFSEWQAGNTGSENWSKSIY
jgi:hypothetical protein